MFNFQIFSSIITAWKILIWKGHSWRGNKILFYSDFFTHVLLVPANWNKIITLDKWKIEFCELILLCYTYTFLWIFVILFNRCWWWSCARRLPSKFHSTTRSIWHCIYWTRWCCTTANCNRCIWWCSNATIIICTIAYIWFALCEQIKQKK